jgi:hypothetical protein
MKSKKLPSILQIAKTRMLRNISLEKEVSLEILSKTNELEKLKSSGNTNKNYDKIFLLSSELGTLTNRRDSLQSSISKRIDIFIFIATILVTVATAIYISSNSPALLGIHNELNLEYYSLVTALVPVLLIALYFSTDYRKNIDSTLSGMTELFGKIIPAIASIGVSLYAVAMETSNGITFFITFYGLVTITGVLALTIILPGLLKK